MFKYFLILNAFSKSLDFYLSISNIYKENTELDWCYSCGCLAFLSHICPFPRILKEEHKLDT